jgi:hypothetical protein
LVSFSIYLILKVIGIWLGDNMDPENPHAHKYTHTKSCQRDLKYFQFIYRIDWIEGAPSNGYKWTKLWVKFHSQGVRVISFMTWSCLFLLHPTNK